MKSTELAEEFSFYSGKVSDLVRQLAFAGLAIVWLFKRDSPTGPTVPLELAPVVLFLVLALGFDFLQYVWELFVSDYYCAYADRKRLAPDVTVRLPGWIHRPATVCLLTKTAWLIMAYGLLAYQLGYRQTVFGSVYDGFVVARPAAASASQQTEPTPASDTARSPKALPGAATSTKKTN